jgi:EPS-associated MarR family transcriptional regulator
MVEQVVPTLSGSPAHGDADAARLAVMRLLEQRPDMSQRELSEALGLSLGKTHYVLHSLLDKGLVKAGNFRRSGNKLAYAYMLTPNGLREKLRLTRAFLSRKEAEFEQLRHTIASLRDELANGVDRTGQTSQPPFRRNEHTE